jgi:hypothetical protein
MSSHFRQGPIIQSAKIVFPEVHISLFEENRKIEDLLVMLKMKKLSATHYVEGNRQ